MLSAEELVTDSKKAMPNFISLGAKVTVPTGSDLEVQNVSEKLSNMKQLLASERIGMLGTLSEAEWIPELKLAHVVKKNGPYWDVLGHTVKSKLYLYPEEALYLLQTKNLQLMYEGVSVSLQRAYALLSQTDRLFIEKYRVFSHLSTQGYKVMRHNPKNVNEIVIQNIGMKLRDVESPTTDQSVKEDLESEPEIIFNSSTSKDGEEESKTKTFNYPINYTENESNEEVLSRLRVIKKATFSSEDNNMEVCIDFDVYIPTNDKTPFKKSTVQLPDYRIRVLRKDDPVPNIATLNSTKQLLKDEVPVIYAIVNSDFISFIQLSKIELPTVT